MVIFRLESASIATVSLAYGGGQMDNLTALNAVVSYGKLTCPMIKDVQLKSKYSAFKFDKIGSLDIQSAYDDYEINHVKMLKMDAQYGDMSIGNVENMTVRTSYTDFKIKEIHNNSDFKTDYGNVRIGSLKNGFGAMNINSNYTDYIVTIDKSISYQLDAVGLHADVQQPISLKTTIDKTTNSRREIIGVVGNTSTKNTIKVRLTYGDFKIR